MRLPCEDVLDEFVTTSVSLHHHRELKKQPAKASDSHSQSIKRVKVSYVCYTLNYTTEAR
eukprot:1223263-Heterocapsa_arctica.AAC.1